MPALQQAFNSLLHSLRLSTQPMWNLWYTKPGQQPFLHKMWSTVDLVLINKLVGLWRIKSLKTLALFVQAIAAKESALIYTEVKQRTYALNDPTWLCRFGQVFYGTFLKTM